MTHTLQDGDSTGDGTRSERALASDPDASGSSGPGLPKILAFEPRPDSTQSESRTTVPGEPSPGSQAERDTVADDDLVPSAVGAVLRRARRDQIHAKLFGASQGGAHDPDDPSSSRAEGDVEDEQRIGRYVVVGTLGRGGMGTVLRAHDETLGRDVALKVLHEGRSGREHRLLREAQALARLSHPNVVQVYDVAEIDGRLCMAMELVHGTPLDRWQKKQRAWPEVLEVYRQAARGLAAAHAQGLVHRDFKPANCILDPQGHLKVLDFGLARGVEAGGIPIALDDVTRGGPDELPSLASEDGTSRASRSHSMLELDLTRTGAMLGTLAYMAPEQLLGQPADPRSDQFSYCVSLFEALFGRRPFKGSTAMGILYSLQSRRLTIPPDKNTPQPVPRWLCDVLQRGLSVTSHDRFPDMDALLSAIDRALARRRNVRRAGLGAVVLLAGGTLLANASSRNGSAPPCEGMRDAPMPAWTDADRQAVQTAMLDSGLEHVDRAWTRVQSGLDQYAQAWTEARAQACEATFVHHVAGEQALARSMACLDRRDQLAQATVDRLAEGDALVAAHAAATIANLPPVADCRDTEALLRGPDPVPASLADPAAEIRAQIARSWTAGHGERGLDAADRAVTLAESLGDAPILRAEALYNRGQLRQLARELSGARTDLEAALALSEQLDDRSLAIDTLRELIYVAIAEQDESAAAAWLASVRGKLAHVMDDAPQRRPQLLALEGQVALRTGRLDEAAAAAEHTVRALAELGPSAELARFDALMLLGDVRRRQKDLEAAEQAYDQARALAEDAGQLPLLARAHAMLGWVHYKAHDYERAKQRLQRALALREAFYEPRSPASIRPRVLLARIHWFEGDLDGAIEFADEARRSLDDHVPLSQHAEVLTLLAGIHRAARRFDEAIANNREAQIRWREMATPPRTELAMADSNIADCLVEKGDLEAARELYQHALTVLELETPTGDARRAYPLFGRGRLRLVDGERDEGIADLRAALEIQRADGHDEALLATLLWELGRALRPAGQRTDPEVTREAVSMVREARERFAKAHRTKLVDEADAWLIRCGPQCAEFLE